MLNLKSAPPLALYVHTPWCVQKCPYCDFNSHAINNPVPEQDYLNALLSDLEQDLPRIWGRRIISMFIGGGTPSVMSADFYQQLISQCRALLGLAGNIEITLEANPGTIDAEKFKAYREVGINRLSIGIQSFNDSQLRQLGRIHDASQARAAFDVARSSGFDNINLDLMFGLPYQTVAQAQQDIDIALQLQPEHLSYYQLTIEPNTYFYHHPPALPDTDLSWEIQTLAQQQLAQHGFYQYEVSAYARNNQECSHNRNYWEFGDYLGIGAGAHSKLTDVNQHAIYRMIKQKHPREYIVTSKTDDRIVKLHNLQREDLAIEFMLNALRLTRGFATRLFEERTGLPITMVQDELRKAEQHGFIEWDLDTIRPTEQGRLFLNNLLELFV